MIISNTISDKSIEHQLVQSTDSTINDHGELLRLDELEWLSGEPQPRPSKLDPLKTPSFCSRFIRSSSLALVRVDNALILLAFLLIFLVGACAGR